MKKLILFIAGTIALVVIIDLLAGAAMRLYLTTYRLPGDCASIDYTIKEINEDVIILGNSAILNSLMPQVIADSIGLSVYNSASNGQGMDFIYSMFDCIMRRHTPKSIIIGAKNSMFTSEGIGERYSILSPYYGMGYDVIDSCLNSTSEHSKLFLKSTFYRYNTIWWRIFLYHFITPNEEGVNGFIGKPVPKIAPIPYVVEDTEEVNENRLKTLEKIIDRCQQRDIKLIVIFPPLYHKATDIFKATRHVKEICGRRGVAVIDNTSDSFFIKRPELFFDNHHLNIEGALIYSRQKATELRKLLAAPSENYSE